MLFLKQMGTALYLTKLMYFNNNRKTDDNNFVI